MSNSPVTPTLFGYPMPSKQELLEQRKTELRRRAREALKLVQQMTTAELAHAIGASPHNLWRDLQDEHIQMIFIGWERGFKLRKSK